MIENNHFLARTLLVFPLLRFFLQQETLILLLCVIFLQPFFSPSNTKDWGNFAHIVGKAPAALHYHWKPLVIPQTWAFWQIFDLQSRSCLKPVTHFGCTWWASVWIAILFSKRESLARGRGRDAHHTGDQTLLYCMWRSCLRWTWW